MKGLVEESPPAPRNNAHGTTKGGAFNIRMKPDYATREAHLLFWHTHRISTLVHGVM